MSGSAPHNRLLIFENSWLEKLTVMPPALFAAVWSVAFPLIAVTGWGSVSPLAGLGLIISGLIAWSVFEYVAHRYLFHLKTQWPPAKWLIFMIHGNHHIEPRDRLRNLMPLVVSIPLGMAIWAGLFALMGAPGTWFFLGFLLGYVTYDMTHYACHQWPMRSPLGRMLKCHHMRHHYVDEEGNYAITGLFWDRIFGTRVGSLRRARSGMRQLDPAE